jgi:LysM repeat protein
VIQDGDTLFGIATAYGITLEELIAANNLVDPNMIRPGDVLIIPGHTAPAVDPASSAAAPLPTEPPRPLLPTPTPSGPPEVVIAGVLGAADRSMERVRVRNEGGAASLEGWTLSSASGSSFTFPRLVLFSGGEVTVHTGPGQTQIPDLYWGRNEPAWISGELLVLKDREGDIVDTYIVP